MIYSFQLQVLRQKYLRIWVSWRTYLYRRPN